MSFTSKVEPSFLGGRSVMTAYDFSKDKPATDPTPTFQLPMPSTRANDRVKVGLLTVTLIDRSGSHDTQSAADASGVVIETWNGVPSSVQSTICAVGAQVPVTPVARELID